jgi:putative phosphoribosyl transferase
MLFRDRAQAGRELAEQLGSYAGERCVLVLALPRGGVPVAFEIASALRAPLDVFNVRKLGLPEQPELALGAIATGGVWVLNEDVVRALQVPPEVIDEVAARETAKLEQLERLYRGDRPPPDVRDRAVILVDDGLATGSTMRAAAKAIRLQSPRRIVVAVPVGAADTCADLSDTADEVVCARTPDPFYAVGLWYMDFSQTTDQEVRALLERARDDVARV